MREAHRETMPKVCWGEINKARDHLAEATLRAGQSSADGGQRLTGQPSLCDLGGNHAPGQKAGSTPHTTPAGVVVAPAGNVDQQIADALSAYVDKYGKTALMDFMRGYLGCVLY